MKNKVHRSNRRKEKIHVIKTYDLQDTIEGYRDTIISKQTRDQIQQQIVGNNITDKDKRREHVANIKEKYQKQSK